jgi:4'-phosphopantetheinyl transferase
VSHERAVRSWAPGADVPKLAGDDVHVWLVDLDAAPPDDDRLDAFLSPAEQARGEAFRFDVHRRRFTAARARLREILSGYLGGDPGGIELVDGPNGKPELGAGNRDALRFNVAHCEGFALCAVSLLDVGVDLELVDRPRRPGWAGIASSFFHADELRVLEAAEGEAGWVEFLRIWTLKEACVKAAGFGLTLDPRSFSVAAVLAGRAESAQVAGREWRCVQLRPAEGAIAALAHEPPADA